MADIAVMPIGEIEYEVQVHDGGSTSRHVMTLPVEDHHRLAPEVPAVDLVDAAFRFLLDREPKESIMSRFGIDVIPRFFPEFPDEIGGYIS